MKCREVQRYCIERAGEQLDPTYQAHLAECADCRRVYERALAVCRLVALKRFERPEPHFDTRTLAAVRQRIGDAQASTWAERLWAAFEGGTAPGFRYALAAAVVAMVGVNVMLLQYLPTLNGAPASITEAPGAAQPLQVASTNSSSEPYAKPVFVFEFPSNHQPAGNVNYGPGAVPVRYDF